MSERQPETPLDGKAVMMSIYTLGFQGSVLRPEQVIESLAQTETPKALTKIVYGIVDEIEQILGIDSYHGDLSIDEAVKGIKDAVMRAKEGSMEPEEVLDLDGKLRDLDFYVQALEAAKKKLRGQQ